MVRVGAVSDHLGMRALAALLMVTLGVACGTAQPASDSAGPPARFVGVTTDGSVVVARTSDGSVERALLGPVKQGRRIQLLDDGRTLFYSAGRAEDGGALMRTSLDGGPSTTVLERVRDWSVSGDGATLAYSDAPCIEYPAGTCAEPLTVVVRNLADGSERRWALRRTDDLLGGVVGLDWVRAPRYVAWTTCGADSCWQRLLDTERTGTLDEATMTSDYILGDPLPANLSSDMFPSSIAMRPSTDTMVYSVAYSSSDGSETTPVVEADAMTQRPLRILFDEPGGPVDFDATGTYMLFRNKRLSWWSSGQPLVPIGDGFVDAAW